MLGYTKTDSKYPIMGRKGVGIYATYCTGNRAGSETDDGKIIKTGTKKMKR